LLRLFPSPSQAVSLEGLYSSGRFAPPLERARSFVYANFISSLDGRISLPDPQGLRRRVPSAIANARDWRLFQELAACADAVLVGGRYLRGLKRAVSSASFPVSDRPEYAELLDRRRAHGLEPQPAVVIASASLELPPLEALVACGRRVYVAAGEAADAGKIAALESQGVRVLGAGAGTRMEGSRLVDALARESIWNVAVIGGGEILHALLADGVLDRLYLTLACRLLGGTAFDTLLTGSELVPAAGFELAALHYDAEQPGGGGVEQLFAIFDRYPAGQPSGRPR
jgi:riboflavin biosynthesis pyrimidine reductase